jgi:nitrogen PTS system EIIA component
MMSRLLSPEGVMSSLKAKSKRQALQKLSHIAAQLTGLPAREIFDKLQQRERLGSTGLGRGAAIPHVEARSLKSIVCLFARLDEPLEFDSLDGEPVDLIFLLLTPEHAYGDYLKALARIARLVREPNTIEWLRTSKDGAAIYAVLTEPPHAPEFDAKIGLGPGGQRNDSGATVPRGPDVDFIAFPAGTTEEVLDAVIRQNFRRQDPVQAPTATSGIVTPETGGRANPAVDALTTKKRRGRYAGGRGHHLGEDRFARDSAQCRLRRAISDTVE